MNNVLEVKNVGKSFKEYRSEFQRVASWFGLNPKPVEEHQILKNINFSLAPGEAVGIVGQNGAGKSTLLKMITGTLKPSTGSIHVAGRISAILELGMGFHPDLTGRQNVYHSAGIMGFSHSDIDRIIDWVEDFSDIGTYFDQPVRVYSSGMQVRVAFAVATAYRPEILIVDEALSVGDAYFQHKSFERIREFQKEGTTLLLVSHDKSAIQAICNRAILIESGMIAKDGNPEDVFNLYNLLIANRVDSDEVPETKEVGDSILSGTGKAKLVDIKLLDSNGVETDVLAIGKKAVIRVTCIANEKLPQLVIGYVIKDRLGQSIYGTNTHYQSVEISEVSEGEECTVDFTFDANLGIGSYSISVAIHKDENHLGENYEWKDRALIFNMTNPNVNHFVGNNWIEPEVYVVREIKK